MCNKFNTIPESDVFDVLDTDDLSVERVTREKLCLLMRETGLKLNNVYLTRRGELSHRTTDCYFVSSTPDIVSTSDGCIVVDNAKMSSVVSIKIGAYRFEIRLCRENKVAVGRMGEFKPPCFMSVTDRIRGKVYLTNKFGSFINKIGWNGIAYVYKVSERIVVRWVMLSLNEKEYFIHLIFSRTGDLVAILPDKDIDMEPVVFSDKSFVAKFSSLRR